MGAFLNVMGGLMPKLSYMTNIDWSIIFLFITLLINGTVAVVNFQVNDSGHTEAAAMIDWVFVLVNVTVMAIILIVFTLSYLKAEREKTQLDKGNNFLSRDSQVQSQYHVRESRAQ